MTDMNIDQEQEQEYDHEKCERCEESKIQDVVLYCSQCLENICEDCNNKYPESYDCGDSSQWYCRKCEMEMRVTKCNVCGDETGDAVQVTDENWEYCTGLDKQFCGKCREKREEPPCDDSECEADICYNAHHEEDD